MLLLAGLLVLACSSEPSESPEVAATATAVEATSTPASVASPTSPAATTAPTSVPPTSTPDIPHLEPIGFPIDPATPLGVVTGDVGERRIDWAGGSTAIEYSSGSQASGDADASNAMGWNCRLHVEYEGVPAVDWYIPEGTPVMATMDGRASLYVVSLPNAFDFYGIDREPYIGNPDRERAPLSPFPGPGGGKGVFVEVANDAFATEYGHLDIISTLELVPEGGYIPPYSSAHDYGSEFGVMRPFNQATLIASWPVKAGEVIGFSGDSGYSEAPHLHYTVRRAGGRLLCPTGEPGFDDGGWLFR